MSHAPEQPPAGIDAPEPPQRAVGLETLQPLEPPLPTAPPADVPDDPLADYPPELRDSGFAARFEAACQAIEGSTGSRPATIKAALRVPLALSPSGTALAWGSFRHAMLRHPVLATRYARARIAAADAFADEATAYARLAYSLHGSDDKLGMQAARLAFDAARWRAGVANPKRYGAVPTIEGDATSRGGVVALPAEAKPDDVQDLTEGDGYTIEA